MSVMKAYLFHSWRGHYKNVQLFNQIVPTERRVTKHIATKIEDCAESS